MTEKRAKEIENKVIYANLWAFTDLRDASTIEECLFNVGRGVGLMQECLKRELDLELNNTGSDRINILIKLRDEIVSRYKDLDKIDIINLINKYLKAEEERISRENDKQ